MPSPTPNPSNHHHQHNSHQGTPSRATPKSHHKPPCRPSPHSRHSNPPSSALSSPPPPHHSLVNLPRYRGTPAQTPHWAQPPEERAYDWDSDPWNKPPR